MKMTILMINIFVLTVLIVCMTIQGSVLPTEPTKLLKSEATPRNSLLKNVTAEQSVIEIYDFHVPRFLKPSSTGTFTCGYRDTAASSVQEIRWLKDDIVFFSYIPQGREVAHVYPDKDWLHHNTLSYMVENITVQGETRQGPGYNINVLALRLERVGPAMAGVYKCKLSMSVGDGLDRSINRLYSREGRLAVVTHKKQNSTPEITGQKGAGYAEGGTVNITCITRGDPAPHLRWSYVRDIKNQQDGEGEVEDQGTLEDKVFTLVGRSRLEYHPITRDDKTGLETRRLGLVLPCCKEQLVACSQTDPEQEHARTMVELVQEGASWRFRQYKPIKKSFGNDSPKVENSEDESNNEKENYWLGLDEEDWTIVTLVSASVLILLTVLVTCSCCISNKARAARKRKNIEILQREQYLSSLERSKSKLHRSRDGSKRQAPGKPL